MRESFGGAFMIKVVMIFIVIYVSFMAVAVNYAKAFRVKNQIINILEQRQYGGGATDGDGDTLEYINDTYLPSVPYFVKDIKSSDCDGTEPLKSGVCIVPGNKGIDDMELGTYYVVTTFISVDFPFFDIHMRLPIRGETKTIV